MNAGPVDKLEARLEALIEGALVRMFRRPVSARDIAVLLLRAIHDNAIRSDDYASRPLAPDLFEIRLHPENARQILAHAPETETSLAHFIVELCAESGYRHALQPHVSLREDPALAPHQVSIGAGHSPETCARTAKMAPIPPQAIGRDSQQPWLILADNRIVPLEKPIFTIGRADNNDVVIADAYVSRHHAQLRKRSGAYILLDVNSRGGTLVNEQIVREHALQNGDLITIGRTAIIYCEPNGRAADDESTQVMPLA